jgi:DNA repair protein RecN (Recombination protein N)
MLQEIHIQNYAVIESLRVDFHPGLNVLTGETGSGKSILVDALALALGGRASPDVIRTGADRATVTIVFQADASRLDSHRAVTLPWATWLDRYGVGSGAEAEIMLRREVQTGGRSRLLVNDEPVTLAAVKELAPLLVEVHGQGEQAALTLRDAQLDLLDAFARADERLAEVRALHGRWHNLAREWTELNQSEQERLRALDLLRFQVEELGQARLEPGEDERLEAERAVLRNLEKVRSAAATAYAALYEDEGSALARLAVVERALDDLSRYDRTLESHRESVNSARVMLDDFSRELGDYMAKLDIEPGRLDLVEDRLALLDRLKRKYGGTVNEMLSFAERARQDLLRLERADERREEVARLLEQAWEAYGKAAGELSRERRQAAGHLAREVHRELAQLGMEKARFEVQFEDPVAEAESQSWTHGAKGLDRITFLLSSNPGEEVRPLDRVASGGEISRLMLALKTVIAGPTAGGGNGPVARTLVFDEVDAGIGGRVAECVGERLKGLSKESQVLCVTHLPQIACFADHHYSVEKIERGGRTFADVQYLAEERDRAAELARMLSGRKVTEAVLEHAAAMLRQGREG